MTHEHERFEESWQTKEPIYDEPTEVYETIKEPSRARNERSIVGHPAFIITVVVGLIGIVIYLLFWSLFLKDDSPAAAPANDGSTPQIIGPQFTGEDPTLEPTVTPSASPSETASSSPTSAAPIKVTATPKPSKTRTTSPSTDGGATAISPYVGTWHAKSNTLVINQNGSAERATSLTAGLAYVEYFSGQAWYKDKWRSLSDVPASARPDSMKFTLTKTKYYHNGAVVSVSHFRELIGDPDFGKSDPNTVTNFFNVELSGTKLVLTPATAGSTVTYSR